MNTGLDRIVSAYSILISIFQLYLQVFYLTTQL